MKKENYGFIYLTTNLINGKQYIGMHTNESDEYFGSGTLILRAIEKYGKENFSREILSYAKTKEELGELEKKYIKEYNAVKSKKFYNIHSGGFGGNTIAGYTEEQLSIYKKHMSEALSGEKHPNYGKKFSNETREKMKNSKIKYWQNISNEDKEKFSNIMKNAVAGEKNPNYGNYWSEEKKNKLSKLRIKNGKSKGELNGMFGKKGENAITGKKIYMYDKDLNLIKDFNTVGLALNFLNLKGHSQLDKAIKNKTLYKEHYWSKKLL